MRIEVDVDVVVIGGGIVGLSCAFALAQAGRRTVVLEKHAAPGEETSSHNSGVIHAGIYYPTGSLKARLCVAGRRLLVERLRAWKIDHTLCGKLIVAVDEAEEPQLSRLLAQGRTNGVDDLALIDPAAIRAREPHVAARAALLSPSTGVFDVADYMQTLAGHLQAAGGAVVTEAEVTAVDRGPRLTVHTQAKGAVSARYVVNAAGLYADEVARLCGDDRHTIYPCRGEYATVIPAKARLINALVYPPPEHLSLGVHLTKTVFGELLLGPTAQYIKQKNNYEWGRLQPREYYAAAQRLCPALRESDLRWGPAGIRPKRYGPGEPAADFFIECQPDDPRIVHLIGIESPGLTASPAIGEMVRNLIQEKEQ